MYEPLEKCADSLEDATEQLKILLRPFYHYPDTDYEKRLSEKERKTMKFMEKMIDKIMDVHAEVYRESMKYYVSPYGD